MTNKISIIAERFGRENKQRNRGGKRFATNHDITPSDSGLGCGASKLSLTVCLKLVPESRSPATKWGCLTI